MVKQRIKYTKPSAKVVNWDFNEAICSVTTNSFCLNVRHNQGVSGIEVRKETTGDWTRVGSR